MKLLHRHTHRHQLPLDCQTQRMSVAPMVGWCSKHTSRNARSLPPNFLLKTSSFLHEHQYFFNVSLLEVLLILRSCELWNQARIKSLKKVRIITRSCRVSRFFFIQTAWGPASLLKHCLKHWGPSCGSGTSTMGPPFRFRAMCATWLS